MDSTDYYLDLKELSKRLSVSPRTVRAWAHHPEIRLPAYRVQHGKLLFKWDEVAMWLEQFRVEPAVDLASVVDAITNTSADDGEGTST